MKRKITANMFNRSSGRDEKEFDRQFWRTVDPDKKFAAAWEMVDEFYLFRGKENATRVWKALRKFGAPLQDISKKDFTDKNVIYQIGIEPNRIDILMNTDGVDFSNAYTKRETSTYDGIPIQIIGRRELIESKQSIGRDQDTIDINRLKQVD